MQTIKQFKISVRNNLGVRQTDDWIYNLNIGNVMHLSLMSIDELPPINKNNSKSFQSGANTHLSSLNEPENNDKNSFETSHELCKDAMLEKIVLISVAYFCTATEMRFII